MNFGVEIRNRVTGRAVTLIGKQAVADFLAGVNASEWEGYKCLGVLPPATQITTVPAPMVDTSVNPVVGEGYTLKTYGESVGVTETGEVVLNPEVPAAMAAVLGDLSLSVGDSGAGDSYLPADAAGEQA